MTDEQLQEAKSEPAAPGYYTSTRRKVADFFLGLFGGPALIGGGVTLSSLQSSSAEVVPVIAVLLIIGIIVAPIYCGRKYISIGAVSAVLIPLIVVGGCMLVVYGGKL